MKKSVKPESFIQKPVYAGGTKALNEFITANLRYPDDALKNKIAGSVYLKYDVDTNGIVHQASVIKGIGHGCDEEAIRLVKLLKYEKKLYRKLRVTFHSKIVIHFRLPAVTKPSEQEVSYNYSFVEKKSDNKISYTIQIG